MPNTMFTNPLIPLSQTAAALGYCWPSKYRTNIWLHRLTTEQDSLHGNGTHQRQNMEHYSMNDGAETILQNKGKTVKINQDQVYLKHLLSEVPESVENYIDKSLKNCAVDQAQSNIPNQFPQLEFNFDLLQYFSYILQDQEMRGNIGNLVKNQPSNVDQMEVDMDMDVQDWIDSLVLPLNTKTNTSQPGKNKEKEHQQNTWSMDRL